MPDEEKFTLYAEPSFVLGTIPSAGDYNQFWDDLAGILEASTGGEMTLSRPGSGRILRVLFTEDGVTFAYHYGIHQGSNAQRSSIRLQPQTAWHMRSGSGETEPMMSTDSRGNLSAIRKQLVEAAGKVLP